MRIQGAETSLGGANLRDEYGLAHNILQDYLATMNIFTGVGFQQGLDAGMETYADSIGFDGLVCGLPFIKPSDVITYPPLANDKLPKRCGDFIQGYN